MTARVQAHSSSGRPGSGRHGVVIGSGMAGLLAARILLDHFDQVTVLDRDRFPAEPEHRKGTPQSLHAHGLLFRGPLPLRPFPGEFTLYSRALLEWVIRARLARHPGLRLLPETEVIGLVTSSPGPASAASRVGGVRVRYRGGAGTEVLNADLVVDASGRGSKAPQWLAEWGSGEVAEEVITSGIGYASRFYAIPEQFPNEWQGVVIRGRPPVNPRVGLIVAVEHRRWQVTLAGYADTPPPTDEAGFLQWARDLPDPSLYEAIRVAVPLTPIRGFRTPTSRWRHFERMVRQPSGFVVTGDAVCAFNPIYAQGMTVAAMDALVLRECLQRHYGGAGAGFERDFQRRLAHGVAPAWFVAGHDDLRWPGIQLQGARLPGSTLIRRYVDLVQRAAVSDPYLTEVFLSLTGLTARSRVLFTPRVLTHVLRAVISRRIGVPTQPFALSVRALALLRGLPSPETTVGQRPAPSLPSGQETMTTIFEGDQLEAAVEHGYADSDGGKDPFRRAGLRDRCWS